MLRMIYSSDDTLTAYRAGLEALLRLQQVSNLAADPLSDRRFERLQRTVVLGPGLCSSPRDTAHVHLTDRYGRRDPSRSRGAARAAAANRLPE